MKTRTLLLLVSVASGVTAARGEDKKTGLKTLSLVTNFYAHANEEIIKRRHVLLEMLFPITQVGNS